MLLRILALLGGAVLLSFGVSTWLNIDLVATFALFVVVLKKSIPALLIFGRRWVASFFLSYAPRKVIMYLARRGVIDRKSQHQLNIFFVVQRQRLANYTRKKFAWFYAWHFVARLAFLTFVMVTILSVSILVTGWWIIFIWLPEEISLFFKPLWSKIGTTLSNSAAVRGAKWFYTIMPRTWLGRLLIRTNRWLDENITKPVERTSVQGRKRWLPSVHRAIDKLPKTHIAVPKAPRQKPSRNPFAAQHIRVRCKHAERAAAQKKEPRPKR